jgi:NAD(P)-dependent dehydrogenase (short-subunit alcohol dehydrogenase family)
LSKKVILITGGSKGLGAEFVEKLSKADDNAVYFTYSDTSADFHPSGNVTPVLCNQKNESDIIDCVARVFREQGKIDVLVNNACSSFKPCDFMDTDWRMFQEILDVNVKGAYLFTREASRMMKQQSNANALGIGNGRIINILSSYIINVPPEKLSFYITAKYALAGLSKATAAELSKYGITVNMISPGLMATQLTNYLPTRYFEAYKQKHPMKSMTTTADVAEALLFLISDGSRFLNGVNIPVNGGEAF